MKPDDYDDIDRAIAGRLREILPPDNLRRRLLAIEPRKAEGFPWPTWLGAAAAAVVLAILLIRSEPLSPVQARADLAGFLSSNFSLEVTGRPLPMVRDWLAGRGIGGDAQIPPGLARMVPVGCREITWQGRRGALICFDGGAAGVIHFAVFDAAGFAPSSGRMPFERIAGWNATSWQKDGLIYFVFAKADDAEIERALRPA